MAPALKRGHRALTDGLPPPPPARKRVPVWLWVVLAVLAVLAAAIAAAAWAWRDERVVHSLLSHVPGTHVQGLRGRPDGGPFEVARIEWRSGGKRVVIEGLAWRDLRWRWRPHSDAWLGIEIIEPSARRIQYTPGPPTAPAPKPQPPRQLRLPVMLTLPSFSIGTLQVNQLTLSELRGQLHLGEDAGRQHSAQITLRSAQAIVSAHGQISTVGELALSLQAQVNSLPEAAQPWLAHLTARGPLARLPLQATLRTHSAASFDVQATLAPFATWPLAALEARTADLDLAALSAGLPSTRLSGRAVVNTSGLDTPASIEINLANALPGRWDLARLPLKTLRLALSGTPNQRDTLDITAFDAALAGTGQWRGSGRWQRDRLVVQSRFEALQPAQLDRRLAAVSLSGPVNLQMQGLPSPDGARPSTPLGGELSTQLEGHVGPRQPPVSLQAGLGFASAPDALTVELKQFAARAGTGRANASATLRRDAAKQWHVQSRGELAAFDPAAWWPGPEGSAWRRGGHSLNARWDADVALPPAGNTWRALRGRAELRLVDSRLAGVALEGSAALRAAADALQVDGLLRASTNHLTVAGRMADTDRWTVELQAPALAALAPLGGLSPAARAWLPQAGTANGRMLFEGRWPALRTEGELQAQGLRGGAWSAARADARWTLAGARADAPLTLKLSADNLLQGERRIERAQVDLSGSLAAHKLQVEATSPLRPPAWADRITGGTSASPGSALRLDVTGAWAGARDGSGTWRGVIDTLRFAPRGADSTPWMAARALELSATLDATGRPSAASLAPGRIELLGAALRWTEARWQPARTQLDAALEPMRVAPWLARLQPHFGWGGDLTVGGHFKVDSGERVSADVVLERASGDLTVTDETGTQALALTDLRAGLVANNGTWHFTQALAGGNVGVLGGAQSLRTSPQTLWPPPDTPLEGVMELRVANLGVWAPWLPPGWRLGGQLRTSASFGGRFRAPEYTGEIVGAGLSIRNVLQGVDVRDGDLAVSLRGADARVERFRFRGGEGELRLEGGASFGATPRADLRLIAQRFQLLGRVDRRIVTSGRAELALQAQDIRLDGRFTVDEGLVDVSRADAPTLDSDVQVARRNRPAPTPDPAAPAAPNDNLLRNARVALEVELGRQLRLRGRGLDTLLAGELRITAPSGRVAVHGTVRTEGGTYVAYGQKLTIERGVLVFAGDAGNPRLDILAVRPNMDVRVGVAVVGPTLNPRVRLISEPEMSELDKLSWLVMGRPSEGLGRADTALLQRAALALLSGGSGGGDAVAKSIGLDELSVRQTQTGDVKETVVTLGKQLSSRWYVGYERGVNATAGTFQLIYRIAQRFTLRAQSGEENALDLIWTWRW